MLNKLIRWWEKNFWWRKNFKIVRNMHRDCFNFGRCTLCDAGNPKVLCGSNTPCPCKYDEYLERKKKS